MALARAAALAAVAALAVGQRTDFTMDYSWRFALDSATPPQCADPNATFPVSYNDKQVRRRETPFTLRIR
jgi:hypothetical protein